MRHLFWYILYYAFTLFLSDGRFYFLSERKIDFSTKRSTQLILSLTHLKRLEENEKNNSRDPDCF